MKSYDEYIKNLYFSDQYISLHPSLHEEDVLFKVSKITPLIDKFFDNINNKKEINLLDVGGGNGLILKTISEYLIKNIK